MFEYTPTNTLPPHTPIHTNIEHIKPTNRALTFASISEGAKRYGRLSFDSDPLPLGRHLQIRVYLFENRWSRRAVKQSVWTRRCAVERCGQPKTCGWENISGADVVRCVWWRQTRLVKGPFYWLWLLALLYCVPDMVDEKEKTTIIHTHIAHTQRVITGIGRWSHQIYMSVLIQDVQIKPNVSYFYEMRCMFWASGVDPTRSAISVFNSKVYALHLSNLIFLWLSRYRPRFAMSL